MAGWIKDRFLIGLLLLTLFVALAMWMSTTQDREAPTVHRGVLDLSEWNYRDIDTFALDGEWEFYPNRLLVPGDIRGALEKRDYLRVPGKWDGWQDGEGRKMEGYGYGTYRLVVRNAPEGRSLAIAKNYVRFADKLYVDGALVGESGITGDSRQGYTPRNVPYSVAFQSHEDEFEILLQVSNFDYKSGGITDSLTFGLSHSIETKKVVQAGLELMGTVILLIFAVLNIGMYVWFHRNPLLGLFGAFFLFFSFSVISNGERLMLRLLPVLPFELAFKIKTISVFMAPALLFLISWQLIRTSGIRNLFLGAAILTTAYCLSVAVLPFWIYSAAQEYVYVGNALVYLALAGYLGWAYVRGRFGAMEKRQFQLYFAAVWSLLLIVVNVILSSENITSLVLNNFGVLAFLIFVSALLIHQYVGAYTSMKRLTAQLQMADQMKDEFLLITSHELNTPLNGIMNLSQALLKEPLKKSTELDVKDKLQIIRNTAYRMSNMVNDIIDAARIRDGKLEVDIRKVDLATCLSVVMEVFAFQAKGRNTQLINRIDPAARYVAADVNRVMQVLYNAIHYSLRCTQDGIVSIGSSREGDRIRIRIDSTTAISGMEDGSAGTEAEGDRGFAVGLSITEELVELMGGTFNPGAGEGLEISLLAIDADAMEEVAAVEEIRQHLPASPINAGVKKAQEGPSKILIASADPVDIEHLYGMLTAEGYEAICASTDHEAYDMITRMDRPDLVLLDIMLPDANGYELCRRIRQHFTQAEMPILLISARSTSADIEAGIAAGGSDFITRPLDPGEIRVRINTLLSMKLLVKEAAVNEMAFLRSQIKPHFLYNALGTIMSLCYTDGARAGELLSIFSRYLRIVFHLDNTEETVKLSKEMELIQAYVDIEKARFGDRVKVEFDIDQELYRCNVMPLTIEPLVENAIRHGVSKKLSGGTVRLTIQKEGEFVHVVVEDDGAGMTPEQVSAIMGSGRQEQGVGFRNIMRRVAHMTGRAPVVESERGVGTKVTIWLPLAYS